MVQNGLKHMPNEVWKDVIGYENRYMVSNLGRVYSKHYKKILSPHYIHCGYLQVTFSKNNKPKNFLVHRLVAEAFIPNPLGLPEVNHIDMKRDNNVVTNLEWCTKSENLHHAFKNGRKPSYSTLNKIMPFKKSSSYLHVYFRKERNRFLGILTINKKTIRVGSYKTDLEAALAVDKYIKEHNLNLKTNF